jgi:hypothetical protein
MNLLIHSQWYTNKSTIGCLYIENIIECFTLEDVVREPGIKIPKYTAIPAGKYQVIVDWSKRFKRPMPHILNVPMFEGIRFHILNTAEETEGCIGLGTERGIDTIYNSAIAFDTFFEKLFNDWLKEEVWLDIVR